MSITTRHALPRMDGLPLHLNATRRRRHERAPRCAEIPDRCPVDAASRSPEGGSLPPLSVAADHAQGSMLSHVPTPRPSHNEKPSSLKSRCLTRPRNAPAPVSTTNRAAVRCAAADCPGMLLALCNDKQCVRISGEGKTVERLCSLTISCYGAIAVFRPSCHGGRKAASLV